MAMYINTNIVSLNAQANLANSQSTLATDIQRLSSGLRINSAADDAAGMAIATRMGSQIAGQNQAIRNANDGISLAQTAQGAMQSIVQNLQTMRSLAVQSANATYSASDRASMNAEVQQLKAEIDRVAGSTAFNGVNLLNGTFTAQNFQVGANNTTNDVIQVASIANMGTSQLGSAGSSYAANVTGTATAAALTAGDLTLNGYQVGASQVGAAPGQNGGSAYSIAAAINAISANSGVTATANATTVTGSAATTFTSIAANTFSINGVDVGAVAGGGNAQGQGANLAAAINLISAQTGVTASADATTGAVTLTASDGRDITIGLLGSAAGNTAATTDKTNFLAQTGFTTGSVGTQASSAVAGTSIAAGGTFTPAMTQSLAANTLAVNGTAVGAVSYDSAAYTAAVASVTGTAGSTYTVGSSPVGTYVLTLTGTAAGTVTFTSTGNASTDAATLAGLINGVHASTVTQSGAVLTVAASDTLGIAITSFNGQKVAADNTTATTNAGIVTAAAGSGTAGTVGVQGSGGAAYNGQELAAAIQTALTTAGSTATVSSSITTGAITTAVAAIQFSMLGTAANYTTATANQTALATQTGLSTAQLGQQAYQSVDASTHGTVSLTSTSSTGIVIGGNNVASAGLSLGTTTASVTSTVNSISAMDVLTASDASNAIATIDGAINTVNSAMGQMGAVQNRFQSVVTTLQTSVQNLSAAQSRIQDTDFAATTASLTQAQILQQAGTAMLAQANALPNAVLTLLK